MDRKLARGHCFEAALILITIFFVFDLLSTMNRGDKSVFKQRRQSAATGRKMSMKSSLDSMREKVAANWDSDNSIDSEGSDWED